MKHFLRFRTFLSLTLIVPITAFAQNAAATVGEGFGTFAGLVSTFTTTVVKATATLLLSLALIAFFWGIVQFIWGSRQGDATKAKNGKDFMVWGMIALFVMFSVYGIIRFGQGILFGNSDVTTIKIPSFDFGSGSSQNTSGLNSRNTSGLDPRNTSGLGGSQLAGQQAVERQISAINQASAEIRANGGNPNQIGTSPAECVAKGGSQSACAAAFPVPVTGSETGNTGFDNCIAGGNGVGECRRMYPSPSCDPGWHMGSTGCVPDEGESGSVTTQSCGAVGLEPNADNSECVDASGAVDNGSGQDQDTTTSSNTNSEEADQLCASCMDI